MSLNKYAPSANMNKKGQFDEARKVIYWMIAGVVISLIVFGFAFIVADYKAGLLNVPLELDANLLAVRFGNIPECFAYEEPVGTVHTETIDLEKFTDEEFYGCYHTDEDKGYQEINFELQLDDKKIKTNEYFDVPHYQQQRSVQVWDKGKLLGKKELTIRAQFPLPYRPSYLEDS